MKHILIAPNAFKNSLTATEAAAAIRQGLKRSKLVCQCECFPIGDGGDGTGELIVQQCGGELITVAAHDPLGRKIKASLGMIDDGHTAVIEMANASGIRLLRGDELDPLHASTFGTGEMIKAALDKGVSKIILTMGGSATIDGGSGILSALGMRFLDAYGEILSGSPESLIDLEKVDPSGLDTRVLHCELIVLCDVDNILLGAQGAAAVFGPQKGASAEDVKRLEASLSKLRQQIFKEKAIDINALPYSGTAGGAAAGLHAFLNAKLVNGIDHFLQLTGFDDYLQRADLVITGEGSMDEQTLRGKGPFGVACQAQKKNIPVIGLAGKVPMEESLMLKHYFNVLMPIGHEPSDMNTAMQFTTENLIRTSQEIGDLLALAK
jgi:glycerate 2-kinase